MKIAIGDPNATVVRRAREKGRVPLPSKRVRNAGGKLETLYVLDVNAETLSADLHEAFRRNVARARRVNRAAFKAQGIAAE